MNKLAYSYFSDKCYNMTNPLKEFRPESLCLLKENQDLWCYPRKSPQDFPVYTENSTYLIHPRDKFKVGNHVLVRWTDGLYYNGDIIQLEEEFNRCVVLFEDKTHYYALYKDIVRGCQSEFTCYICDSTTSEPPDEIVICDKCFICYHQSCHVPNVAASDLNPDLPWMCRVCVFSGIVKLGGAPKKGSNARLLMQMKLSLPYDLQSLTWDSTHRSNLQQLYCYCGGPGEWVKKMLQCTRCLQWFHEACLQCLEKPLLLGDRFYIFICSMCNNGPEFLRRMRMRWVDVAHLVLYNLTLTYNRKYYDLDVEILPYLKENWNMLQLTAEIFSGLSFEQKKTSLLQVLQNSKSRFSFTVREAKYNLYGLKSRRAPLPPVVTLPNVPTITNEILDSFSKSKKSRSLTAYRPQPTSTPLPVKQASKVPPPVKQASKVPPPLKQASKVPSPVKQVSKVPSPVKQASKVPSVDDDVIIINSPEKNHVEKVSSTLEPAHGRLFRPREVRSVPVDQEQPKKNENKRKVEDPPEEKQVAELKKKNLEKQLPSSEEEVESMDSSRSNGSSRSQTSKFSQKPQRKLPHRKAKDFNKPNGPRKLSIGPPVLIDISGNDDTTSSYGTLNTFIPPPTDFEGPNNPFLNNDAHSSTSSTSVCSSTSNSKIRARLRSLNVAKMGVVKSSHKFTASKSLIRGLFNHSLAESKVQSSVLPATPRSDLSSSKSNHLKLGDCIPNGNGGKYTIVGKRLGPDSKVQYLVQWDNLNPS